MITLNIFFRKYFKWKHDNICINQGIKEKCYNREKHSFTTQFGWQTMYHSRRNNQYALTYSETAENNPNEHILTVVWIWKSKWQCKTLENKIFWKFSQYKYDLANLVIKKKSVIFIRFHLTSFRINRKELRILFHLSIALWNLYRQI